MNSEAIIFIQALTLLLTVICIVGIAYTTKAQRLHWGMYALPILLLANLGLFLSERLLVKVFMVDFGLSAGAINSWSILIQLQLPLTGIALLGTNILSTKKSINGKQ